MTSRRLLLLLPLILLLSACCSPLTSVFCCSPSGCKQAQDGFAHYAPLISALEQYKKEHGDYPQTLNALVPKYVPGIEPRDNGTMRYDKKETGYRLVFTYSGPGMNVCAYEPEKKKWDCYGYF